ncbi:hypothetical protein ACPWSR_01110 [Alloiococcus sp. CFN-8]|uniref:hypothetical protein n=1 Tax=Alloiococcus sp. CFN-8 TaxID=3416081 RepID=UPI003CF5096F
MRRKRSLGLTLLLIMLLVLTSCSNEPIQSDNQHTPGPQKGLIYLYGESHGEKKILDRELELWYSYYHKEGMRHLFVELPYYTAEFLNLWLQSDSDDILESIYKDWSGTPSHSPYVKEFYKEIKDKCPETIFHGTDIGHQHSTTGQRYLRYLKSNNLEDSEEYLLSHKSIEQGEYYYKHSDEVYRENMMVENFIKEYEKLSDENIMGIYGAAHTGLDSMNYTGAVPSMANQLKEHYGNTIHSEDLTGLSNNKELYKTSLIIDPLRVDKIKVNKKVYEASYFGKQDLSEWFKDYAYREFWRLENSYNDFQDNTKTGDFLPYDNYPMVIETKQVFVIDYKKTDGSVIRKYYRSDGRRWQGTPTTEEFGIK